MKTSQHKCMTVFVNGVEAQVHGVIFYPYVPATDLEPAEQPMCEWDKVTVGGIEVTSWFEGGSMSDAIEEAIIGQLEAA